MRNWKRRFFVVDRVDWDKPAVLVKYFVSHKVGVPSVSALSVFLSLSLSVCVRVCACVCVFV